MIDLFHHLMDIYRKITETDLRENQKTFDEALNATMPVDKYFEIIDDFIQYADYDKNIYTSTHIINNTYNTVLATVMYIEHSKMWHKKLSSEKTWAEFRKFFA